MCVCVCCNLLRGSSTKSVLLLFTDVTNIYGNLTHQFKYDVSEKQTKPMSINVRPFSTSHESQITFYSNIVLSFFFLDLTLVEIKRASRVHTPHQPSILDVFLFCFEKASWSHPAPQAKNMKNTGDWCHK